jgi:L,D-peptidoglycan transpeptidase YkuD (ErfK/YbiS/YcfS/YnhG family)
MPAETNPADGRAVVRRDGLLRFAGQVWRCALGKGGIRRDKREGDGATPVGLLPLRRVFYRADRMAAPACRVAVEPIAASDGWCDDPAHRDYNRRVTLPHEGRHEALWREDEVYDIIGVLGWNDGQDGEPIARGRGSAIFLHLARPDLSPTEGCIALPEQALRALLAGGLTAIAIMDE